MALRQIGFIDEFPMEDLVTFKNLIINGTVDARADFLAVENIANYAAGKTLPLTKTDPIRMTSASIEAYTDEEILGILDGAIGAHQGKTAINWAALLQAALQFLPLILPLLKTP